MFTYYITLTFTGTLFSQQKQCIDFAVNARPTSRYMPKNKKTIKYKIWRLVVSTKFEYIVMTLIALNTIVLMMKVRLHVSHFLLVVHLLIRVFPNMLSYDHHIQSSVNCQGRWITYFQVSPLMTLTITTSMSQEIIQQFMQFYKQIFFVLQIIGQLKRQMLLLYMLINFEVFYRTEIY